MKRIIFLAALLTLSTSWAKELSKHLYVPSLKVVDYRHKTSSFFDYSLEKNISVDEKDLSVEVLESPSGIKANDYVLFPQSKTNFCVVYHAFANDYVQLGCQKSRPLTRDGQESVKVEMYVAAASLLIQKDGDMTEIGKKYRSRLDGLKYKVLHHFPGGQVIAERTLFSFLDTSAPVTTADVKLMNLSDLQ